MTRRTRLRSILSAAGIVLCALTGALESAADWEVYVAGGIGISTAAVDTDGTFSDGLTTVVLTGVDDDSSPLIDGAVGLKVPMDELVPREWLLDLRLPDWPMRFEIEGAGLREYEFQTLAGVETYASQIEANTFFVNIWQDLPMTAAYRPVQYLFGLGRQPRVRQWLAPASFFAGAGVGFAAIDVRGTSNVITGSDDLLDFAWNVGAGINYALTDKVDLSMGYRYVGLPDVEVDLQGPAANPQQADLTYEDEVHEFRVQVRVEVWDFLSPWR